MRIGVIGLGLIGSSIARALTKETNHIVTGYDLDEAVQDKAIHDGVISGVTDISNVDVVVLAIYPSATIEFVRDNIHLIQAGTILTDCVGVKRSVMEPIEQLCKDHGVYYVGGHPMAGKERGGYEHGSATMLDKAYMLLVGDGAELEIIKDIYASIGMRVKVTTADEHDKIIAYTSQLAHVVSGAYVTSGTSRLARGFSAGSFKDMTRVARLNENMWTELMMMNRDHLASELNGLIERLSLYRDALQEKDIEALRQLLKKGKMTKEEIDR